MRATGLHDLEGGTFCAIVWDSNIDINYDDPLTGVLKGENLGTVAFEVLVDGVNKLNGFSSSSLPSVAIEILDADVVCGGDLELVNAPVPPIPPARIPRSWFVCTSALCASTQLVKQR